MKSFFLSRVLREKILLLGLVLVAALMWLFGVTDRAKAFRREYHATTDTLKMQQMMLDARESIQARAAAAIAQLDPASTFDAVRLQAELDTMATAVGIANKTIDTPRTEKTAQFSVNTTAISMRNIDYASLAKFYEELKKRAPYIGLANLTIQSNAANVNQLTATFRVSSVEVAK